MKVNVEIGPKAEKFLKKIKDPVLLKRIVQKIVLLERDPLPKDAKVLQGTSFLRVRMGDYKIIYKVDDKRLCVIVFMIGHRRDIYDKFQKE